MHIAFTILIALYALYVGGRLKQSEAKLEIIRAALDRHLTTGEDYRSAKFKNALTETAESIGLKVIK